MRSFRTKAFILAAVLALTPAVGCKHDVKSSSSNSIQRVTNVDEMNIVDAAMTEEKAANETLFTLNRVIDAGIQTENNEHYIYLDINIKNPTDKEYELSTLNNFFLELTDGTQLSSAVRTQLYAVNNFSDKYSGSPFTVPASGEFKGIIGGFTVPDGTNQFTIGFFPTKEDENNKTNLFRVKVNPTDIISVPEELKK